MTHVLFRKLPISSRTSACDLAVSSNPGVSISTTLLPPIIHDATSISVVQERRPDPTFRSEPHTWLMNYSGFSMRSLSL